MIFRRKPKSTVTALRAPPASRMRSGRARAMRAAAYGTAGLAAVGLTLTAIFAFGASASTQPALDQRDLPAERHPRVRRCLWHLARSPGGRRHRLAEPRHLE